MGGKPFRPVQVGSVSSADSAYTLPFLENVKTGGRATGAGRSASRCAWGPSAGAGR
jgi:hypothetical protein